MAPLVRGCSGSMRCRQSRTGQREDPLKITSRAFGSTLDALNNDAKNDVARQTQTGPTGGGGAYTSSRPHPPRRAPMTDAIPSSIDTKPRSIAGDEKGPPRSLSRDVGEVRFASADERVGLCIDLEQLGPARGCVSRTSGLPFAGGWPKPLTPRPSALSANAAPLGRGSPLQGTPMLLSATSFTAPDAPVRRGSPSPSAHSPA